LNREAHFSGCMRAPVSQEARQRTRRDPDNPPKLQLTASGKCRARASAADTTGAAVASAAGTGCGRCGGGPVEGNASAGAATAADGGETVTAAPVPAADAAAGSGEAIFRFFVRTARARAAALEPPPPPPPVPPDEGVPDGLPHADALGGVQRQHAAQQIRQLHHEALVVGGGLLGRQHGLQVIGRPRDIHRLHHRRSRHRVLAVAQEAAVVVKVALEAVGGDGAEVGAHHARREPPPQLLHLPQHVVVVGTWEEGVAGEELVQAAGDGPNVQRGRVLVAQDDLGGAVEPRHEQGGGDVVLVVLPKRGPKVRQLDGVEALVGQDVVRLDVGVDDVQLGQQVEGEEELQGVGAHGGDGDAHPLAKLVLHVLQIHGHGLKHEAHVSTVVKVVQQAHTVVPPRGIGRGDGTQQFQLLGGGAAHGVVGSDHLHSHLRVGAGGQGGVRLHHRTRRAHRGGGGCRGDAARGCSGGDHGVVVPMPIAPGGSTATTGGGGQRVFAPQHRGEHAPATDPLNHVTAKQRLADVGLRAVRVRVAQWVHGGGRGGGRTGNAPCSTPPRR